MVSYALCGQSPQEADTHKENADMQNHAWMATNWAYTAIYYRNKSVSKLRVKMKLYHTSFSALTDRCKRSVQK